MSEQTLSDFLAEKVEEWLAGNGGGFLNAFVTMVDFVDEDGAAAQAVAKHPGQATYRSLGMANYLAEWFVDDAHRSWAGFAPDCDCEDD